MLNTRILAYLFSALTLLGPTASHAEGVAGAVRMSGSPRLAAYLLTDPRAPAEAGPAAARLLDRMGLGQRPTEWSGKFSFSPFIRFDPNLNGGFPDDHVTVSGIRFEIAEAAQAVSGPLIGGTLSYGGRVGLGGGTALELRGSALLGYAPGVRMSKTTIGGEGCLRHAARRDLYLHACLDASSSRFELGRSERIGARLGASRILSGFGGVHELTLEGRVERHLGADPYSQTMVSASLLSAMPGPVVYTARVELGAPVEGAMVTRSRVQMGASFNFMGRQTGITLDWRSASGAHFLGAPRRDQTLSLSVSRQVSDRVQISAGISRNASTAAPFTRNTMDFGLAMRF